MQVYRVQVSSLEKASLHNGDGALGAALQDAADDQAEEDLDAAIDARLSSLYRLAGVAYPGSLP